MVSAEDLQKVAAFLRKDVLEMTSAAGSGHPTSCLSAAEIIATLFFDTMKYDPKRPAFLNNDEFILSKGHAAPILYAALQRAGCIKEKLQMLRKHGSPLEGHPIPSAQLPWIKVATGSLGQGLSVGLGMALAAKSQGRNATTYVLLGDSEFAEGSNYEAMNLASYYSLDNLYAIVDMNGLGQTGQTMLQGKTEEYRARFNAAGWATAVVDGHNISEMQEMLTMMRDLGKPVAIIARTIKGRGVSFLEDQQEWHGRTLDAKQLKQALQELPLPTKFPSIEIKKPSPAPSGVEQKRLAPMQTYKEKEVSTREAFGNALLRIAKADSTLKVLDGEVSNSTITEKVKQNFPQQFIQTYIAEQNLIGVALGLSKKGNNVVASTFSAFLTRAHDQLRMSSLSQANFIVNGSHAGCSIGEDGPSQMGLEDIALFRSLPGTTIFYPSDAYSSEKLTELAHTIKKGIVYLRTTRAKTPIVYDIKSKFEIGKFSVLQESKKDNLVLIGSGITVHESLRAAKHLKKEKVSAAVVDLYCLQPLDVQALKDFVHAHGNKVVVAEDHYSAGGIGEMLSSVFVNSNIKIECLSVQSIPHSGPQAELLNAAGIDDKAIVSAARKILKQ